MGSNQERERLREREHWVETLRALLSVEREREREYVLLVENLSINVCCQTRIYKEWSPICLKETNNYARSRV